MQVLIPFVRDAAPGMDGNLAGFRVSKEQTNLSWVIPLAWRVFISRSSFANQEKCNQNTVYHLPPTVQLTAFHWYIKWLQGMNQQLFALCR